MSEKTELFKKYFGHSSFRPGQEECIDALLSGRDVLGVMPTGAGKSVCYQLPAIMLPGLTLVISPLISLMKDQVTALNEAGISAAYINSTLDYRQYFDVLHLAARGYYKLIYIAPERLASPGFLDFASRVNISLVAVDEAHCVSQWGQDFRPHYLKISQFTDLLPKRPPIGAFTATATKRVSRDIEELLKLREPLKITTGFDRPNLFFDVKSPLSKMAGLKEFINRNIDDCGIVYCSTRRSVDNVFSELEQQGYSVTRYHAGLKEPLKRENQEDFVYGRKQIMVATNAFGMGIDKSNVRYVVHYNMPLDMESYYQEAGRAGRDGAPAHCLLLYSDEDYHTAKFIIDNSGENIELSEEERKHLKALGYERLRHMYNYCHTYGCLRAFILNYFGESNAGPCGCCGRCVGKYLRHDYTVEAQKILSAAARAEKIVPEGVRRDYISSMLLGLSSPWLEALGFDRLSTFGIMKDSTAEKIESLMERLIKNKYLMEKDGLIKLEERAKNILFHGERVYYTNSVTEKPRRQTGFMKARTRHDTAVLMKSLKNLRRKVAKRDRVPDYMVLSDATLAEICRLRPHSEKEFAMLPGVNAAKARRYGEKFIAVLKLWEQSRI